MNIIPGVINDFLKKNLKRDGNEHYGLGVALIRVSDHRIFYQIFLTLNFNVFYKLIISIDKERQKIQFWLTSTLTEGKSCKSKSGHFEYDIYARIRLYLSCLIEYDDKPLALKVKSEFLTC